MQKNVSHVPNQITFSRNLSMDKKVLSGLARLDLDLSEFRFLFIAKLFHSSPSPDQFATKLFIYICRKKKKQTKKPEQCHLINCHKENVWVMIILMVKKCLVILIHFQLLKTRMKMEEITVGKNSDENAPNHAFVLSDRACNLAPLKCPVDLWFISKCSFAILYF